MSYRQFQLRSDDARLVCWLEDDPRLHAGRLVTLKGDDRHWEVVRRSLMRLDTPPDTRWRVGGLL